METCYNGAQLFPGDPSWAADSDILDTYRNATHFHRQFYAPDTDCQQREEDPKKVLLRSSHHQQKDHHTIMMGSAIDDTVVGAGDDFVLPYHICVGPFGAPRPWGIFELVALEAGVFFLAT